MGISEIFADSESACVLPWFWPVSPAKSHTTRVSRGLMHGLHPLSRPAGLVSTPLPHMSVAGWANASLSFPGLSAHTLGPAVAGVSLRVTLRRVDDQRDKEMPADTDRHTDTG